MDVYGLSFEEGTKAKFEKVLKNLVEFSSILLYFFLCNKCTQDCDVVKGQNQEYMFPRVLLLEGIDCISI